MTNSKNKHLKHYRSFVEVKNVNIKTQMSKPNVLLFV